MNLQQTVGNRAVAAMVGTAAPTVQRDFTIGESPHYGQDRDQAHADAKTALLEADGDGSISNLLFGKHRSKKHAGKCVTTFNTSAGGYLVVVTYATLGSRPRLTYDTAFLSRELPPAPEATAIAYAPQRVIQVGSRD